MPVVHAEQRERIAEVELEAELDALNQCIDLFSSEEMANVGDEMLDKLNSL